MVKVQVTLGERDVFLSIDEAKEVMNQLKELFGEKDPYFPWTWYEKKCSHPEMACPYEVQAPITYTEDTWTSSDLFFGDIVGSGKDK